MKLLSLFLSVRVILCASPRFARKDETVTLEVRHLLSLSKFLLSASRDEGV